MLQLLVVYYGPYYIFSHFIAKKLQVYSNNSRFAVNYAAYFAEIFPFGIQSVKGTV